MTDSPAGGTDLVVREPQSAALVAPPLMTGDEIERCWRIATALHKSGIYDDVRQAEQAFAKIILGRDLALTPAQSMNAFHFVKGNVQIASVTLATFVKRHPQYDYKVIPPHNNEQCTIWFLEADPEGENVVELPDGRKCVGWFFVGESKYTIEDANKAGLVKDKSAWKTAPKNMVFARAMSNGVKWYCPDVVGGMPVYTEGDSFPDERRGEVLGSADEEPVVDHAVVLPPAAERVLARAAELGHDGLADRATAEMTLGGQDVEFVKKWYDESMAELDAMEKAAAPADAETTAEEVSDDEEDDAAPPNPDGMREHANSLLDQSTSLRDEGKDAEADALEDEATTLMQAADRLDGGTSSVPGQMEF